MKRYRSAIGAWLWMLSIQYYVVQLLVASQWMRPHTYSWAHNTISDLANTHCGLYGTRNVCSPAHIAMNISFVVLGCTMLVGAVLLLGSLSRRWQTTCGLACLLFSGFGTVMVGLFPENTSSTLHIAGAALPFVLGNVAMLALGVVWRVLTPGLRAYTFLSGAAGLLALPFLLTQNYLGLGIGGLERVVSYPLTIWMTLVGIWMFKNRQIVVAKP